MRLKSLASYRNLEDFIGVTIWHVKKDRIIEGELTVVTNKMVGLDRKLVQKQETYFSLEDAEVRFVREAMLILSDGIDYRNMINMIDDLKERRPHLFL